MRLISRRNGLAGLLLLALVPGLASRAGPAEAGAPAFGKTYRDKNHKFSLPSFKGWEPIPVEAGEKTTVCKLADPKGKGQMRGTIDPSIEVVRVAKEGAAGPATTPGAGGPATPSEPPPGLPPELLARLRGPADAFDALVAPLAVDPKHAWPKKDFKPIESKDGVPGRLWVLQAPHAWYGGPDVPKEQRIEYFLVLAAFEKDKVEVGLRMMCGHALRKDYEKAFVAVAKGFQWFDDRAEDVASLPVLDGVAITPKRRHEIEKSMVDGWDVVVSPKKQYVVIYNTKRGENVALAKLIAERIEKIREQVYELQFPPARPITNVSICRVCKDRQEYHAYGGPGGSAGYWNSWSQELVFYDASAAKKADADTLAVLYHEAFHQYIFYSVGEVAPHSWFNEGHGDYYAGARYVNGKFQIAPFAWRVGTIRGAIVDGPRERTEGTDRDGRPEPRWGPKGYTPLEAFVRFTQGEYYAYPGVSYAQGWSLIYFLREVVPGNKKYAEKWGRILSTYFDVLKAEVNAAGPDAAPPEPEPQPPAPPPAPPAPGEEPPDPDDPLDPRRPPKPPGDAPGEPEGGEDEAVDVPRTPFRGRGGEAALKKAVEEAFKGVDFAELEEAWKKATKSGK